MRVKRLIAALMTIAFLMGILPAELVLAENEVRAVEESDENYNPADWIDDSIMHEEDQISLMASTKQVNRYTILTLDVSGSMGNVEMNKMKEAANLYCDRVLSSRGHNYVAVVKFGSSASLACGFTDQADTLRHCIDSLYDGGGTDTAGGLRKAKETYEALGAVNVTEKNIILISDGGPNSAGDAQNVANQMFSDYNIYTIGYNLSGSAASFMQSIQNCGYYSISSSQDITDAIDQITGQILNGASGNVNHLLTNENVVTVLENKRSASAASGKFVASEGAKVTMGNQEYYTDSSGTVTIPTVTSGTIKVFKEHYLPKTVSAQEINISGKVYLEKDEGDAPILNSVLLNGVNVLYEEYGMDLTKGENVTITADVIWKKGSYQELYLVQDSKRVQFSGNQLFLTIQDHFDVSEDIYIVAVDSIGNHTKKKLLFVPNGGTPDFLQGFKFSMGGDMSFTLPDSTGFLAGSKVGVGISSSITDLLPVEVAVEDGKVYLSIGVDLVNYTKSDKYATNSQTKNRAHVLKNETKSFVGKAKDIYNDIKNEPKDLFDTSDITSGARKLKSLKAIYGNSIKYPKGSFGVDADFTLIGFGEGYIDSDGNFQWLDGGLILCPSASVSWSGQFAIGPVPAYWEASIKANVDAQLNLYRNEAAKKFMPSGDISGSLKASIGAGAGVKKLLSLGGGINGTLSPLFRIYPNRDNYFRLDAKLNGYFKVTVIGLEYTYDTKKLKLQGTWIEAPKSTNASFMSVDDFNPYDSANYQLIDRSYTEHPTAFVANDAKLFSEQTGEEVLVSNAYPYSAPQLVELADGTELLVWLDDVRSREAVNRTAVFYSHYANGEYSEPKMVEDDGTADFYPYLYQMGDRAYLAWSNEKTILSDSDSMQTMLQNLETKTAEFDPETLTFQNICTISNRDCMNIKPILFGDTKLSCAWMSNSENSIDAYSGYDLMLAQKTESGWTAETEYARKLNSIDSFAGYEQNGTAKLAYCMDTDGDLNTVEDIRLYVDGNAVSDTPGMKTNVVAENQALYWYDNASIQRMELSDGQISSVTAADETVASDHFQVASGADGTSYVFFSEYDGLYAEIYGYVYDVQNHTWSRKTKFTDTKQCTESFGAAVMPEGAPVFLVNRLSVVGEENSKEYQTADLVRIGAEDRKKLEVLNIGYDPDYVVEGNDLELSADIQNSGWKTENITLSLSDQNGNAMIPDMEETILAGETKNVTLTLPMEAETERNDLKLTLSDGEFTQEKTFSLKREDLAVENIAYRKTGKNQTVISADIVNRGYGNGTISVCLRKDSAEGEVLAEKAVTVDELLDVQNVSFALDAADGTLYYITIASKDDNSANNYDYVVIKNRSYTVENGTIKILEPENPEALEIEVPSEFSGTPVTAIGDSAYDGCSNARNIILPDTIETIGEMAFAGCTALSRITIPRNVRSIGENAFSGCSSLAEIQVSPENPNYKSIDGVLFQVNEDQSLTLIKYPEAKGGSYIIPENTKVIGAYAFDHCTLLDHLTISNAEIGEYAFRGCTALESVIFQGTIPVVADGAFLECSKLSEISLPFGVSSIGANAFWGCTGLEEVTIPNSVKTVENGAFSKCESIRKLTIPSAYGYLGSLFGAASYNENEIYVPKTLREVILTGQNDVLESYAFYRCSSIETVWVGNESVNSYAFRECTNLKNVTLSYQVIHIQSPFLSCPSDMVVYGYADTAAERFSKENPTIQFQQIEGELPHEVYKAGECGYGLEWTIYYDHVLELSGIGAMPNASSYGWTSDWEYIRSVKVNEGITGLGTNAFSGHQKLTRVSLPGTLKKINSYAFSGCGALADIVIPSGVVSIGDGAFRNCTILSSVQIGENVQTIGSSCFEGDTGLSEIILPESVSELGKRAFYGCTLLSDVVLSNGISKIGERAFGNCTALEAIKLPYTVVTMYANTFEGHLADMVIRGYSDSYAEDYAAANQITFEALDETIPKAIRTSGALGDDILWELSYDGELRISGAGAMPEGSNGTFYPWYPYRNDLKSVSVNGITSIGAYAFDGYPKLRRVTMGSSVRRMGTGAFRNCSQLKNVSLSEKLEAISNSGFSGCTSLREIYVPGSVETIYESAFYGCRQLSGVTLSEGVRNLRDQSFGECLEISRIEIPYTVVSMGAGTFSQHAADMVLVGYRSSYAEDYAQDYDFTFEALEGAMPDAVRAEGTIGNDIVWKLKYDGTLILSGIGLIPEGGGYGYSEYSAFIKNVVFEEGITSVGGSMFNGYTRLRTVTLPEGILSIGAYAFQNCRRLKRIVIPNTVTEISRYAFSKCAELQEVEMSEKLANLQEYAFLECPMLSEIKLSYSVVQIANNAFSEHSSSFVIKGYAGTYAEQYAKAQKIPFSDIGASVPDIERASGKFGADFTWSLSYNGTLTIHGTGMMPSYSNVSNYGWWQYRQYITQVVVGENVTSVGMHAFQNLPVLASVILNDEITLIDAYAFAGCEYLTKVQFPKKLSAINACAFSGCKRFSEVNLPDGLEDIREYAFDHCTAIEKIYLPYTVMKLQNTTFSNCLTSMVIRGYQSSFAEDFATSNQIPFEALEETMPNEVYVSGTTSNGFLWSLDYSGELSISGKGSMKNEEAPWKNYAMYLRRAELGEGITSVGTNAFSSCTKLLEVSLPSTLKSINYSAFQNDTALKTVHMAEGISEIGEYAFAGCTGLERIVLPNTVKTLGNRVFSDCNRLFEITLGNSLNTIGQYCFANNTALKEIIIPASVNNIHNTGFYNHVASFKILCYPKTYAEDFAKSYGIPYETLTTPAQDGIFQKGSFGDFTWSISYTGELKIEGVGSLPDHSGSAWNGYSNYIKSLTVCDGITSLGRAAFQNLKSLETVRLADSVKTIGEYAFDGDQALREVLTNGAESIQGSAFRGCSSMERFQLPACLQTIGIYAFSGCGGLRSMELPIGATAIGDYAFEGCTALESILIPYTVTTIGAQAFANRSESLVVRGYQNSYAKTYAESRKITFELVSGGMEGAMDSGKIDEDFTWSLGYDGVLTISGAGMMPELSGYDWQKYSHLIQSVVLEDGITTVGSYLCSGLTALKTVSLPKSIQAVGSYAFYDCRTLETIRIPENTVAISANAFDSCSKLNYIYFGSRLSTIDQNAFYRCNAISKLYYDGSEAKWSKITIGNNNQSIQDAEKIYQASKLHYDFLGYQQKSNAVIAKLRVLNSVPEDLAVLAVYREGKLLRLTSIDTASELCSVSQPLGEGETVRLYAWSKTMTPYLAADEYTYQEKIGGYQDVVLETPHNYYNNMNEWYEYTYENEAKSLDITFSQETMTEGCDYIYIYDRNDTLIGTYSGNSLAGQTINVPGNTVKINFRTDGSVVFYGFRTESIYVNV